MTEIAVILPCYNESGNLEPLIELVTRGTLTPAA